MCDYVAGELLVCHHKDDVAARFLIDHIKNNVVAHVEYVAGLRGRLTGMGVKSRHFQFEFHLLRVPEGQELFKINYLQAYYRVDAVQDYDRIKELINKTNLGLQLVPNSILSVCSKSAESFGEFRFSKEHLHYKNLLGWEDNTFPKTTRLQVLDTGIAGNAKCNIHSKYDLLSNKRGEAEDENGHGTAVASVINDICSSSELVIQKVANKQGRVTEWDLLAALAIETEADVINISLAFGLDGRNCPKCGRLSHSSRSVVFENMLDDLLGNDEKLVVVAASGNASSEALAYPARFRNVVAIGSVNQHGNLSGFSNFGTEDQAGEKHRNVFLLPGGEDETDTRSDEYIGRMGEEKVFKGTSFSAAYASGLIASMRGKTRYKYLSRENFLAELRHKANKSLPDYDKHTHGNGLMKFL